ncbi:MAG: hypothetical protein AB7V62_12080 [Thermoleophilia bacterium]
MTGAPDTAAPRTPRVILVVGAAGGSGASLLAGGVALALQRAGVASWLVEMASGRGDLADAWDLPGDRTVDDLLPVMGELAPHHLRAARREHPSGLGVLVASGVPGGAAWDPAATEGLLTAAAGVAGEGGACVADAGTGLGAPARGVVAVAGRVLVVCPPRVAAARRARAIAAAIDGAGRPGTASLVVAAGVGRAEIGMRALGRAAGVPVAAEIPWSPGEAAELGAGRWPRGRAGRGLRGAVEGLVASWT